MLNWIIWNKTVLTLTLCITQFAGAVNTHDCISAEENECPGYDTKQSDGVVKVMLELWGMWSMPSLPLFPGPLWHGMVVPDRVQFMG